MTGGKASGSAVKFANFYLVIDGSNATLETNILASFKAFMTHLKSKFSTGKGGDSAFKLLPDGSFQNAYTSIADSFKFIEEAITVSNANGVRPPTNTGRADTALSGKSRASRNQEGSVQQSVDHIVPKNLFGIGINCDAEAVFNKDPKDPNKYEIEGVKT